MLEPRSASAFANEESPHPGAPTQGAKKGLQAKQGLTGAPILACEHVLSPPT